MRSFARSLTCSRAHGKEIYVYELNASISDHSYPECRDGGVAVVVVVAMAAVHSVMKLHEIDAFIS